MEGEYLVRTILLEVELVGEVTNLSRASLEKLTDVDVSVLQLVAARDEFSFRYFLHQIASVEARIRLN